MKSLGKDKPMIRTIPKDGPWPDTTREDIAYSLSRPPWERVKTTREFLRTLYLKMHRPWPTHVARKFRPFESEK